MKKIFFLLFISSAFCLLQANDYENIEQEYGKKTAKRFEGWQHLIKRIASEKEFVQVRQVNAFFNRYRYRSDAYNWQTVEYWATFKEFMSKGSGDCEDFALAKYYTLRKLGIPDSKLQLITGEYSKKGHMVLVYYKDNNDPYMLDKNNRYLIRLSDSKRFKPQTYFNESEYGLIDNSVDVARVKKEHALFLTWWDAHE